MNCTMTAVQKIEEMPDCREDFRSACAVHQIGKDRFNLRQFPVPSDPCGPAYCGRHVGAKKPEFDLVRSDQPEHGVFRLRCQEGQISQRFHEWMPILVERRNSHPFRSLTPDPSPFSAIKMR